MSPRSTTEGGGDTAIVNLGTGSGHSVREVIAAVERIAVAPCRDSRRRAVRAIRRNSSPIRPLPPRSSAGERAFPTSTRLFAPRLPGTCATRRIRRVDRRCLLHPYAISLDLE
jgi:hypothetical protein